MPAEQYHSPSGATNARAPLSTRLASLRNGYPPISCSGKRPAGNDWQKKEIAEFTIRRDAERFPEARNTGYRTGFNCGNGIVAIDIDVLNKRIAAKIERLAERLFRGEQSPLKRVGMAPKIMLVGRVTAEFRKRATRPFLDEDGNRNKIECLGDGQQFVAFGVHPDTGKEYEWIGDGPLDVAADELPMLNVAAVGAFLEECEAILLDAGWTPDTASASHHSSADSSYGPRTYDDLPERDVRAVVEEVVASVASFETRDNWIRVGMGLHHWSDGSDIGFDMWHALSKKTAFYQANPQKALRELEDQWASFCRNYTGKPCTMTDIVEDFAPNWHRTELLSHLPILTPEEKTKAAEGRMKRGPLDEQRVIEEFARKHMGELLFDHHAGKWFRFTGTSWRREETKLALSYARELSTNLAQHDPKAKALRKVAIWEAIERGTRADRAFAVTSEIWDRDPLLLGTPGGTIDLRTGQLREGRPEDHISRVTAVAPIPLVRFDPDRDCPTWLAFLKVALGGDTDAIRFLQVWGGYNLTGLTLEQKLVFVYGPGGSGKGTAINTMADVMGDYAVNVGMETLTESRHDRHTTELARLNGARMARASETEKGRAWAENRIKTLTGQDKITARFMRQDDFEFLPQFKLTIFGNNRPSLKDVDAAIMRRFLVLLFDHPPKVKDVTLPEKLKAEWSGILSWLIVGCLEWQKHGLRTPAVVDDATSDYFASEDTFGQWLTDHCEIGKRYAESTERLWVSWTEFADECGEPTGSRNKTFPETLSQRGFTAIKNTNGIRGRGFAGLRLLERRRRIPDLDEE